MSDVFISYARADRDRVRLVAHGLIAEGFSVWWDPDIKPGKKWNAVIRRELDNAAAIVTCWTPAAAKSDWVVAETTHGHGKRVLAPAMLRRCAPPIPYNMIQSADLTRWRGRGDDPEWIEFLRQVRALVEAKRRMLLAAPPPGEAEAQTYAQSSSGSADRYIRARGRSGLGPRLSRWALGTLVVGAALTAGLWSFAALPSLLAPEAPRIEASIAPPAEPAPALVQEAAPPEPALIPEPETPAPAEPAPTPISDPTPAPPVADPTRVTAGIDVCVQRLAAACTAARGRTPIGFARDRQVSAEEAAFLRASGVTAAPPTEEALGACRTRVREGTAQTARACRTLAWQSDPAPAPAVSTPAATEPPRQPAGQRPSIDWGGLLADILSNAKRTPAATEPAPQPPAQTQTPAINRRDAITVDRAIVREQPQEPVVR